MAIVNKLAMTPAGAAQLLNTGHYFGHQSSLVCQVPSQAVMPLVILPIS